ncbi:MAG: hypothetical protein ABW133_09105 [Polyangiaceae bacterium]
MNLLVRRALAFLAWTPLLVAAGCNSQSEGDRCDRANNNNDCEYPLVCKQVYINAYHYICCPNTGVATVANCNASSTPPPEAGTLDAGEDGATEDATDDGASDSSDETPVAPTDPAISRSAR